MPRTCRYAAALSQDVIPREPKGIEILGMKLVLFRDDKNGNKVCCINDICPHRAAPLSLGWLSSKEGHTCVVCPYHGWAFDGDGRLHDVPAAEKVTSMRAAALSSTSRQALRASSD